MGYLRALWSQSSKIPYLYFTGYVRFTCRHHRGPHRRRIISYGLPKGHRPVRLPVLRPGTTRRHYGMLWSRAYGPSVGYLRVLWSRGCKIPYVYFTGYVMFKCGHPEGLCGFHTGMGTSVRSILRELYGPMRVSCGLGNIRSIVGAGPHGVR